jgi:hypothetical protein
VPTDVHKQFQYIGSSVHKRSRQYSGYPEKQARYGTTD